MQESLMYEAGSSLLCLKCIARHGDGKPEKKQRGVFGFTVTTQCSTCSLLSSSLQYGEPAHVSPPSQAGKQASSSSSSSSFAYLPPPPPYRSPKLSPLYRSTPNVAATLSSCSGLATGGGGSVSLLSSYPSYQSLTSHQPGSSSGYSSMARGRCFSQQSLASSSLSSAPSGYSASTQSLTGSYEPYSEVMLRANSMLRVRSDESILSSSLADTSDSHALAEQSLPPPPPYRPKVRTAHKYVAYQCCA